ncbi:MAG TPA: hypothetical protein VH208_12125 [Myxococcaceae bacterium]|nr:hypothetical protein [Myxococcaceae bacterium]
MIGDFYEVVVDMTPKEPMTFRVAARKAGRRVRSLRDRRGLVIEERTRTDELVRDAVFMPERVIACVLHLALEPEEAPRRRGKAGSQMDWTAQHESPALEATG